MGNETNAVWGRSITIGGAGAPDDGDVIQYTETGFLVVVRDNSGNGSITVVGAKHDPYLEYFCDIELESYNPQHAEKVIMEYYKDNSFWSEAIIIHPKE